MAVALDTTFSGNTGAGTANTVSASFTVGAGANRYLLASVALQFNAGQTVSSVVWTVGATSQNLTQAAHKVQAGAQVSDVWTLLAPTSGAGTLVATTSGSATAVAMGGDTWTGVDQAQPLRDQTGASVYWVQTSATTAQPSVSVNTAAGETVVDFVAINWKGTIPTVFAAPQYDAQTLRYGVSTSIATFNANELVCGSSADGSAGSPGLMKWQSTLGGRVSNSFGASLRSSAGLTAVTSYSTPSSAASPGGIYVESLPIVIPTAAVNTEAIVGHSFAGSANVEATQALNNTATTNVEALRSPNVTGRTNVEALNSPLITGRANVEAAALVSNTGKTNVEALKVIQRTNNVNAEALIRLLLTGAVNVEAFTASIPVHALYAVNVEAAQLLRLSGAVNVEATKILTSLATTNVEAVKILAATGATNVEAIRTLAAITANTNVEAIAKRVITGQINVESLRKTVYLPGFLNVEAIRKLAQTGAVNVEGFSTNALGTWQAVQIPPMTLDTSLFKGANFYFFANISGDAGSGTGGTGNPCHVRLAVSIDNGTTWTPVSGSDIQTTTGRTLASGYYLGTNVISSALSQGAWNSTLSPIVTTGGQNTGGSALYRVEINGFTNGGLSTYGVYRADILWGE